MQVDPRRGCGNCAATEFGKSSCCLEATSLGFSFGAFLTKLACFSSPEEMPELVLSKFRGSKGCDDISRTDH
jgi:hypothetical protein